MEGFMRGGSSPGCAGSSTRRLAIIPRFVIIGLRGEGSVTDLLTLSQVVLALQLPLAMFPLLHFTSSRKRMGAWRPGIALLIAAWLRLIIIHLRWTWLVAGVPPRGLAGHPGHGAWTVPESAFVSFIRLDMGSSFLSAFRATLVLPGPPTARESRSWLASARDRNQARCRSGLEVRSGESRLSLPRDTNPDTARERSAR